MSPNPTLTIKIARVDDDENILRWDVEMTNMGFIKIEVITEKKNFFDFLKLVKNVRLLYDNGTNICYDKLKQLKTYNKSDGRFYNYYGVEYYFDIPMFLEE